MINKRAASRARRAAQRSRAERVRMPPRGTSLVASHHAAAAGGLAGGATNPAHTRVLCVVIKT